MTSGFSWFWHSKLWNAGKRRSRLLFSPASPTKTQGAVSHLSRLSSGLETLERLQIGTMSSKSQALKIIQSMDSKVWILNRSK